MTQSLSIFKHLILISYVSGDAVLFIRK